jgi:hypothetical protein
MVVDLEASVPAASHPVPRALLPADNESLMRRAYAGSPGLVAVDEESIRRQISYPETTLCRE